MVEGINRMSIDSQEEFEAYADKQIISYIDEYDLYDTQEYLYTKQALYEAFLDGCIVSGNRIGGLDAQAEKMLKKIRQ